MRLCALVSASRFSHTVASSPFRPACWYMPLSVGNPSGGVILSTCRFPSIRGHSQPPRWNWSISAPIGHRVRDFISQGTLEHERIPFFQSAQEPHQGDLSPTPEPTPHPPQLNQNQTAPQRTPLACACESHDRTHRRLGTISVRRRDTHILPGNKPLRVRQVVAPILWYAR